MLLLYVAMANVGREEYAYSRTMASVTAISVEDYLHTVYRPDCDYVGGEVIERNLGAFEHSTMQGILVRMLYVLSGAIPIRVLPELRMRISATRFRIPDVCVMLKSEGIPDFRCELCVGGRSAESNGIQLHERRRSRGAGPTHDRKSRNFNFFK